MSGHSHFATIKRQKGLKDAQKSNIFGKLSKNIAMAIKSGGSTNPDMNFKLRIAIDKAKEYNMPKDNIDRILKNADAKSSSLEEITYEGFGPFGINVLLEVVTDNKNRSAQEFKNIFEKAGGTIAGPGAVSHIFENKGCILVEKETDLDSQTLKIIDLGALDLQVLEEGIEVFVAPNELGQIKDSLLSNNFKIISSELRMEPKTYTEISNPDHIEKITKFLEDLEGHEDVSRVFSNF